MKKLLTLFLLFSYSVQAQQVPQDLIGTRTGKVTEWDGPSKGEVYRVNITLNTGGFKEKVGTVNHPDYRCGGDLYLKESTSIEIAVIEMLTYGKTLCVNEGAVKLSFAVDKVIYEWQHHSLPNRAQEVLRKKTS